MPHREGSFTVSQQDGKLKALCNANITFNDMGKPQFEFILRIHDGSDKPVLQLTVGVDEILALYRAIDKITDYALDFAKTNRWDDAPTSDADDD